MGQKEQTEIIRRRKMMGKFQEHLNTFSLLEQRSETIIYLIPGRVIVSGNYHTGKVNFIAIP